MTRTSSIESRIAALISAYADRAPIDVDPVAMTQFAAAASARRGWRLAGLRQTDRALAFVLLVVALLVTIVAGALIAGAEPFHRDSEELLTERGFVEPFNGLPPEGALPSSPETGELILTFNGRVDAIGGDFHFMWLYADGRLIWRRNLDIRTNTRAFGTTEPTPAFIEQRLSSQGVELLRTAVIAGGRVVGVPRAGGNWIGGPGVSSGELLFRDGEQLVEMTWSDASLPARLADPATWLPADAWEDRRLGGYVPTLYAVCFDPRLEDRLPGSVLALLRSSSRGVADASNCGYTLTIPDARVIAATLDDGGFARLPDRPLLEYRLLPAGAGDRDWTDLGFSPVLPNHALPAGGG